MFKRSFPHKHHVNRSYTLVDRVFSQDKTYTATRETPQVVLVPLINEGKFVNHPAVLIRDGKNKGHYKTFSGNLYDSEDITQARATKMLYESAKSGERTKNDIISEVQRRTGLDYDTLNVSFLGLVRGYGLIKEDVSSFPNTYSVKEEKTNRKSRTKSYSSNPAGLGYPSRRELDIKRQIKSKLKYS